MAAPIRREVQTDGRIRYWGRIAAAGEADPDEVRAELHKILAEARGAKAMPWDDHRAMLYRTIFPQMTGCLPEDEGAQLRFEFEAELKRLKAA